MNVLRAQTINSGQNSLRVIMIYLLFSILVFDTFNVRIKLIFKHYTPLVVTISVNLLEIKTTTIVTEEK